MALSVTTRKCDPEVTVIDLSGRITLGKESGQIEAAILKALSEGAARLVVNLAEVTYVDSTGIGIIAYCFGKVSQAVLRERPWPAHRGLSSKYSS